ncbi:NB-ARC domain-containing protein [Streptomyces sp. NPDC059718]
MSVGTCFQVAPGIVVTAWHVLADLGCGGTGSQVLTDALNGSAAAACADVVIVDAVRDLAVLRRTEPLPGSVAGWAATDSVGLLTKVVVTGVSTVNDPGHDYRYLQATGTWQGGTVRDGSVPIGRLSSSSVVPGMSGAPVLRLSDGMVLGVVSARYNSADGWLRDSVWVVRTEDLTRLLDTLPDIGVRRRLVLADEVSTVLSASPAIALPMDDTAAERIGVKRVVAGPGEAALEAAKVLTALDSACRGGGQLEDIVNMLVSRATAGAPDERDVLEFRRRLQVRGLDPRVLLPRLTEHEEAVRRWMGPLPGEPTEARVPDPAARYYLVSFIRAFVEELSGTLFSELSEACRRFLIEALEDGETLPLSGFLHALGGYLPPLPSTSVEAVLVTSFSLVSGSSGSDSSSHEDRAPDSAPAPGPAPGRPGLAAVAAQLSRLPEVDPCTAGRTELVARIATAIDRRMTRHQCATAFLSGQPGVGTSTVAIEAARALIPAFAGGVFHIDLHGLVPGARRDARTVVRIVSEALGLALGTEAMDDAALFASFATQLRGRQVLLVLDNALDAAHVKPLVKAASGCGIIVTSRDRAQGYADPGLVFEVKPLQRAASVEVLTRCGEGRDDDASLLQRLAHLCGDVPLALRMIGARMTNRPDLDIGYLVQILEEEAARLDYLEDGDRAVRLAMQLSYNTLDPNARRVFRLITAAPGSAVTGPELGHCLDAPAVRQELLLNRLVDRSLAQQEIVRLHTGSLLATFTLFDLVRLFATERLAEEEPPDVVRDFQRKSVSYLSTRLAEIADEAAGAQISGELDPARFHAAQQLAQDNDWMDLATDLAVGLHVLYTARRELDSIVSINDVRIALHLRQGHSEEAVRACLLNADNLRSAQAGGPAADAARQASRIARDFQLPDRIAEAEFKLSLILWDQEDWSAAVAAGEQAVSTLTSIGRSAAAVPIAINNCRIARQADDPQSAVHWGRTATEMADRWGSTEYRAMARNERGLAESRAGHKREALHFYRSAAVLWETLENWWNTGLDYNNAADMAGELNDPAAAAALRQLAIDFWERDGSFPRVMEALIDLSATHAATGSLQQTRTVLNRAEHLVRGLGSDAASLLKTEVLIRHAAACLFGDGSPSSFLFGEVDKTVGAEGDADQELEGVRVVLQRHRAGELTSAEARKQVRAILCSPTRNRTEPRTSWVYEEMGVEVGNRPQLDSRQERAG